MERVFIGLADLKEPPEGFETYIWSSEGCVNGIKWCKQRNKKYTVISVNWGEETYANETVAYLKEIRQKIIGQLSIELNHYHSTTYSIEAWDILLFEWAAQFLFSYYDKYIRILNIIERDLPTVAYVERSKDVIPATDFDSYSERLRNDWYVFHQYSMLFRCIGEGFHNLNLVETDNYGQNCEILSECDLKVPLKKRLLRRIEDAVVGLLYRSDRENILVASDVLFNKAWILKTRFLGIRISRLYSKYDEDKERIYPKVMCPDASWRNGQLNIKEDKDAFCSIVYSLIKKELPYIYLEGHKSIKEYVIRYYGKFLKAKVFIHGANTIYSDEVLKLVCALMRDNGSIICDVQHGGNYGIEKHWHYDDEYALSDIFYTFGWKRNEKCGCMFRPMPPVKLMFENSQDNREDGSILYVSYSFSRYLFRQGRPEFEYANMISDEVDFFKRISPKVRKRMRIRLYMYDYGWGIKENIEKAISGLIFDMEPDFCKSLDKADCCVFSDWETTVNQALYLNKPFIALRDLSFMMEEAKQDVEKMHSVGVICYSWDELVQRVNELEGRWHEWWNENNRQSVIDEMRNKYAWTPDNAEEIWRDEFKRLLSV